MALAAAQVVDALAARIAAQAGLGTGGVKTSRAWPWAEADLPACRIYAASEQAELVAIDGLHQHNLSVDAEYTVRATADLDDALHAQAAAGLALLFAAPAPYGLQLTGISREAATEGEASVGRITLQISATFAAYPAAPETIVSNT
jgi:hypothetical protein